MAILRQLRARVVNLEGKPRVLYDVGAVKEPSKDMTAAFFYRSAVWIFMTTLLVLLILNLLLATIGGVRLHILLDNLPTRVLLGALGVTGALGGIALWIGMMWNCLTLSNASKISKIGWFLLILFTNMLGASIYYFRVYRRGGLLGQRV